MCRILFLSLFMVLSLFADSVKFKEEKYVNALQTSVNREGILKIEKDFIEINYKKDDKSFIFYNEHIISKKQNKKELIKYEDNIELAVFIKLIKGIYKNQFEDLKEYFKISSENGKIILIPNEYISSVIEKIEYKKNNEKLEFLEIYFVNEDRIKIVQTN